VTTSTRPPYAPSPALLYGCRVPAALVISLGAIYYIPLTEGLFPLWGIYALIPVYLVFNALPYVLYRRIPRIGGRKRSLLSPSHSRHTLRSCAHGVEMLHTFLLATGVSVVYHLARLSLLWTGQWGDWLISAAIAVGVLAVVFWNGMLCLYIYSVQLGIRWRVIGALCGLLPVIQLLVLRRIMQVVDAEVEGIAQDAERYIASECAYVSVKDKTKKKIDYASFEGDNSLRGEFVRSVRACEEYSDEEKAQIIAYGLKALAGREVIE